MAVSIQELINQKDKIEQKKQETFDIDTSVGKLTVKKITKGLMAEIMAITDGSDEYCSMPAKSRPLPARFPSCRGMGKTSNRRSMKT